jgi:hypothetical protein
VRKQEVEVVNGVIVDCAIRLMLVANSWSLWRATHLRLDLRQMDPPGSHSWLLLKEPMIRYNSLKHDKKWQLHDWEILPALVVVANV